MYIEPSHLRRPNSNLSLYTQQLSLDRGYPRSVWDLERQNSASNIYVAEDMYPRIGYGGSQNQLHQQQVYQSQTLPRSFLKRNEEGSRESLQQQHAFSSSQNRLSSLLEQHQKQLQQQNQYLSNASLYPQARMSHRSIDNMSGITYVASHPTTVSNNGNTLKQPSVQWPAAIPSSPIGIYVPASMPATHLAHGYVNRSNSNGNYTAPKFQRAYAFDEQRRASSIVTDAFDLDEMERERRRSHASLFNGNSLQVQDNGNSEQYDMINGTAV